MNIARSLFTVLCGATFGCVSSAMPSKSAQVAADDPANPKAREGSAGGTPMRNVAHAGVSRSERSASREDADGLFYRDAGAPRLEVEYACPMHSDIRQLKPGSCPRCGMKLEPKPRAKKPELIPGTHEGHGS